MNEQPAYRLYVGSYPPRAGECGIYLLEVDRAAGSCSILQTNAETENPSYLVSAGGFLFAANEQPEHAQMSSFSSVGDGPIRLVDMYRDEGAGTCQVAFDPIANCLYGADYESGSISGCRVRPDKTLGECVASVQHTGSGPNAERQEGPHVHMVGLSPDVRALIAVDLGTDTLTSYALGEDGALQVATTPPPDDASPVAQPPSCRRTLDVSPEDVLSVPAGEGPRMVAHHPTLPLTALITELGSHLIVYRREGARLSSWKPLATYPLVASDYRGEALAAHVLFSPDGRYLYASVRGPNQIVVFSVDESGALERHGAFSSGGSWPRHMEISPDGALLAVANERSDEVVVFEVNKQSGLPTKEVARCAIISPTCAAWQR